MTLLKSIDLIKFPVLSDKSVRLLSLRQYCFLVDKKLTKLEVKKVIEFLFAVSVVSVNSCTLAPKSKRVGKFMGHKSSYKKVIVTLARGNCIGLFPDS